MMKLSFGLKALKLKLDEWGFNINKHKCFEIPEYYYYTNKHKFGAFLAGLIDADGCFNFNKKLTSGTLSIALGDLNSCYNLQKIIKRLYDIDSKIRREKNYNNFYFNCNHSYKKAIVNFKKYEEYIFPYIRLKTKQVKKMGKIYNGRIQGLAWY